MDTAAASTEATTTAPTAVDDDLVRRRVRAEQVELVYRSAASNVMVSALVAGITCMVLLPVTPHGALAAWFGVMLAMAVMRLALVFRYRAAPETDRAHPRWERRFVVSIALTSAAWGVGGLWVMPADSITHQAVVYFFLIGMCSGTAAIYAAHVVSVAVAITLIMVPSTVYFLLQADTFHLGMAFGTVIYIAAAARATRMLNGFLGRSWRLAHQLEKAREAAERSARTDALTGIHNRRAFYEMGEPAVTNAGRSRRHCAVIMLDLDRFKSVNDRHGHAMGDLVIRALADVLRETVRAGEIIGRLGGEEFGVVIPDGTAEDARGLAERLRARVESLRIRLGDAEVQPTSSFGVADSGGAAVTLDALLARADQALYRAKEAGRNRVVVADG